MSKQEIGSALMEVEITFRLIVDPCLVRVASAVGKTWDQAFEERLGLIADEMCRCAATLGAVGEYKDIRQREYTWADFNEAIPKAEKP